MTTRKSASSGMDSEWWSSVCRYFCNTPCCSSLPRQAWNRNILGLPVRVDCVVALKVLMMSLMLKGFPSIARTAFSLPWLRMQQTKASPCSGAAWRPVNMLPDHSFTPSSCSWERSLGDAKQFNARCICSWVWSLQQSTLNPSQLNTSAKLSAGYFNQESKAWLNVSANRQEISANMFIFLLLNTPASLLVPVLFFSYIKVSLFMITQRPVGWLFSRYWLSWKHWKQVDTNTSWNLTKAVLIQSNKHVSASFNVKSCFL